MIKLTKNRAIYAGLFLAMSGVQTAHAGLLEIVTTNNSIASIIPLGDIHDVAATQGASGWYNANLFATDHVQLTYEYLGSEAAWTNIFMSHNQVMFSNHGYNSSSASVIGDQGSGFAYAGSLINFTLGSLNGGNGGYGVFNGSNHSPYAFNSATGFGAPNYFLGYASADQNSVYIGFDDGGGPVWPQDGWDDNDYDDLVIKVSAVSEPTSLALLTLGVALFGWTRRKS